VPSKPSVAGLRNSRFSRSSNFGFTVERPPVILEWGSWILRIGHAEQHTPQHLIPWECGDLSKLRTEEEWYMIVSPFVSQIWDRLMMDPSSRRVVCVTCPFVPRTFEAALKQALWNLGVPAVCFVSCLETVPYVMGWKRGLVVRVERYEAQCLVVADGHALHNTFQAVPCGYETVVPNEGNKSNVQVNWDGNMDKHWLDDCNPNGLMMALLKCLNTCPRDVRKDAVSNLVFCGDTLVLVPDLGRRISQRLIALLNKSATSFDEEPVSELTVIPNEFNTLSPLSSCVAVTSTAPLRPDLVSWVGASLWATVWHRHDDEHDAHIKWTFAPNSQS
jgi:hypothetical protein